MPRHPLVADVLQVTVSRIHPGRRLQLVIGVHVTVCASLRDRPDGFCRPSVTIFIPSEIDGLPAIFMAGSGVAQTVMHGDSEPCIEGRQERLARPAAITNL